MNFLNYSIIFFFSIRVAQKCDKNLMTVGNLAVCFGPTLLRPEEETVASIIDIKFYNIVVEILIENCDRISAGLPQEPPNAGISQNLSSSPRVDNKDDQQPPAKPQSLHKQQQQPQSPQSQLNITGNGAVNLPCYSVHTVVPATVQVHISIFILNYRLAVVP